MVPRFHKKPGSSFKGAVQYLTHDAGHAKTAERVAWTHTLNLANDHVPSAVDEMLWTFRNAELLKAEAGIRAGGSVVDRPVKHLSLNWDPSEKPGREDMIQAAESLLARMRWSEHQCIIVCHTDRPHPHIHLVINMIHPGTGRCLDASFERRHAQKWALAYEQERGRVFCQQRLLPLNEREPAPPRPVWLLLEKARAAHERAETEQLTAAPEAETARKEALGFEWKALKALQKDERLAHVAEGRAAFKKARNQVYREVRKTFAKEWNAIHAARLAGVDPGAVAALKAELAERQRIDLETRRDAACDALREAREATYRQLLDAQQQARDMLETQQRERSPAIALLTRMAEAARAGAPRIANENRPDTPDEKEHARQSGRLAPLHPAQWSEKAGLAHQQRSALRYLEYNARRGRLQGVGPAGKTTFERNIEPQIRVASAGNRQQGMQGPEMDADPD